MYYYEKKFSLLPEIDPGEFRDFSELKNQHGLKKLQYIWDYYKLALVFIAILLYIVIYIVNRSMTAENPRLYIAPVNVSIGDSLTETLTEDYLDTCEDRGARDSVYLYTDLLLSEAADSSDATYIYACQMKILSAIDDETIDLVLMNEEAFDAFAQNGYLCNMEDFLSSCPSELSDYFADNLVSNIEILEDNSIDVKLDDSIEYQAEYSEYPMALDVTELPVFSEAGFTGSLYLGILANTPRTEEVTDYLAYLAAADAPITEQE